MEIVVPQIGIDVAKDELVVSIDQGKPFVKPNTPQGCLALASLLPEDALVHVESSGGYERLVRRTLTDCGMRVVVHNPLKSRRIAQAQGVRAKTDPVDAKLLSRSGQLLPETKAKSFERQRLSDHSRAIDALKEAVAAFKTRMAMPELDAAAKRLYEEAVEELQKQVDAAEKEFDKRAKKSECAASYKLIQTVPCLGKLTARRCVCEFPEDLLERSPKNIASYAGLAPVANSSGKRQGKARLGHGNARLKAAFYMPALAAIRYHPWARELYDRLKAQGSNHQAAIVAVMRRLLLRAVAVVRRGSPWQLDAPHA